MELFSTLKSSRNLPSNDMISYLFSKSISRDSNLCKGFNIGYSIDVSTGVIKSYVGGAITDYINVKKETQYKFSQFPNNLFKYVVLLNNEKKLSAARGTTLLLNQCLSQQAIQLML